MYAVWLTQYHNYNSNTRANDKYSEQYSSYNTTETEDVKHQGTNDTSLESSKVMSGSRAFESERRVRNHARQKSCASEITRIRNHYCVKSRASEITRVSGF